MSVVHTIEWSAEECAAYRQKIKARMIKNPQMEAGETERVFLAARHTEPLVLYRARRDVEYAFNSDLEKDAAYQQIRCCLSLDEPMPMFVIHHDFSVTREHNLYMPQSTTELFDYIDKNAEALVQEMLELGILERVVAAY